MSNIPQREMTLEEWVDGLPEGHLARKELADLKAEIALKADYIKRLEERQGFHPSCLAIDEHVERLETENEALREAMRESAKVLIAAADDALLTGEDDESQR